jgi:hypothetical protein
LTVLALLASLSPVARRNAIEERPVVAPRRADRPRHLEREASPVFERAAVAVGPLVGDGRAERVQEVAVRAVNLDEVEADALGPVDGVDVRLDEVGEVRLGRLLRLGVGLGELDR